MTQNYYRQNGGNRPKDGSKNKVCGAINLITTGAHTIDYRGKVLGNLDGLPAVDAAHFSHKDKSGYQVPNGDLTSLTTITLDTPSRYPSPTSNCHWGPSGSSAAYMYLHAGNILGADYPPAFCNREIDFLHAVAHLLTPNTAALHGFEFVTILIDLAERFGLASLSKKDSKAAVKSVFIDQKIKTFKRTRPPKTPEQLIAELKKIHSNL